MYRFDITFFLLTRREHRQFYFGLGWIGPLLYVWHTITDDFLEIPTQLLVHEFKEINTY